MNTISKSFQVAMNEIDDIIDSAIKADGRKKEVIYSGESDEYDIPINNLSEVILKGKVKFMNSDKTFESEIIENPTWLDVVVIANRMIIETEDYHHIYFESLYDIYQDDNGVLIATLSMGS